MILENFFKNEGILRVVPKIKKNVGRFWEGNSLQDSGEADEESKGNMLGKNVII